MDAPTQKLLLMRAKHDPEAFGLIFDAYFNKILGYTVRRVGNVAAAEDIVADTFTKAFAALPRFAWRGVSIEAWLYAIATNEIRMYFRRHKPEASLDELFEQDGFEVEDDSDIEREAIEAQEKLERHEAFVHAQRLLRELPLHYQEVLTLRFTEDKKINEIAHILGKREGTVKSLLSRGLALLRENMAKTQPSGVSRIVTHGGRRSKQAPHPTDTL